MFNRNKIKELKNKISFLEEVVEHLNTKNNSMFRFVFESAREKYIGKCFFVETRHSISWTLYNKKNYVRVNSVDFEDNKILLKCTCIIFSELDNSWNISEGEYSLSVLAKEITEKEFQDAYTEYAISKGLLPKEEAVKKENITSNETSINN